MRLNKKLKNLIEKHPVALATVMPNGKPNVIGVAAVKVVAGNKILISDVFMKQTLKDIKKNPSVAIVTWDKNMSGCKFIGKAKYFKKGRWFKKVKALPENKKFLPKGAVLVDVKLIIPSA